MVFGGGGEVKTKLRGRRCQCSSCDGLFNSEGAFNKHRVGRYSPNERACLNADAMVNLGMVKNSDGFWVTEAYFDFEAFRGEK